jgi:hypothetical protein
MKKILVSILLMSSAYVASQDKHHTPRPLVEAFKEKHEQEVLLKKVRAAEQDQKSMIAKIKRAYANMQFPQSIKQSYQKVLLCISALCAIVGTAAIIHHLIGDFSLNTSLKG